MSKGIALVFYNVRVMRFFKHWAIILSSLGSIASIIGLIIFCFSDQTGLIISLSFFCACLLLIDCTNIRIMQLYKKRK